MEWLAHGHLATRQRPGFTCLPLLSFHHAFLSHRGFQLYSRPGLCNLGALTFTFTRSCSSMLGVFLNSFKYVSWTVDHCLLGCHEINLVGREHREKNKLENIRMHNTHKYGFIKLLFLVNIYRHVWSGPDIKCVSHCGWWSAWFESHCEKYRQEVWRLVKLTLEVHGLLRLYLFLEMIYVHCFQSFILRHCVLIPSCYPKIILMIIFEL